MQVWIITEYPFLLHELIELKYVEKFWLNSQKSSKSV